MMQRLNEDACHDKTEKQKNKKTKQCGVPQSFIPLCDFQEEGVVFDMFLAPGAKV